MAYTAEEIVAAMRRVYHDDPRIERADPRWLLVANTYALYPLRLSRMLPPAGRKWLAQRQGVRTNGLHHEPIRKVAELVWYTLWRADVEVSFNSPENRPCQLVGEICGLGGFRFAPDAVHYAINKSKCRYRMETPWEYEARRLVSNGLNSQTLNSQTLNGRMPSGTRPPRGGMVPWTNTGPTQVTWLEAMLLWSGR